MRSKQTRHKGSAKRPVIRVEAGIATSTEDYLAEEVPVAMHFNGTPYAVMMTTPADLEDFAYGFALTERGLAKVDDVEVSESLEGIVIDIRGDVRDTRSPRDMPGRSGCGICGSRELEDIVRHPEPVGEGISIHATTVERALEELRDRQPINTVTGSVHAAAWIDAQGTVILVREDVGRHNALDKLIGAMRCGGVDPTLGFAVITSRASYEMVTKAATAGIAIVAAISAPTALAVHLADACNVTLLGFARPGRFVMYAHERRVRC
ncbi:FdhD protein [Luteibacter rhizovicinus]|uniref:Sulfur carrier protein FdhD n=1 Tax=Luteibacter rhizovicinus TaxID=242606 RepID=A0A4R3YTV0_9GAMM|nr:formate dehydrogenase accessory sulfurtransferase FdhD [Luteibacter rhizovicinus]TCV95940.1 FdhD protein [Luteibacter rhizovicinus]